MWLNDLERDLQGRLPEPALAGQQISTQRALPELGDLTVRLRINRNGQRAFTYTLEGMRLERATLLKLVCMDIHCPDAASVREKWARVQGMPTRANVNRPRAPTARGLAYRPLQVQALMEEETFEVAGHHFTARPAVWPCDRTCAMGAHSPVKVDLRGWDLFEGGVWIAGGLSDQITQSGRGQRPRFESLAEAKAWVVEHKQVAEHAIAVLRQ